MLTAEALEAAWVPNRGGACTTASILAALGALGAHDLPELGQATLRLGAREPYGPPALMDYVGLPGRRAPLDLLIEALAREHGLPVRSSSGLSVPRPRLRRRESEALVVNLGWGQEARGRYGTWGWHALRPATYTVGGHSVVLLERASDGGWVVLDPNHEGVQRWPRPGWAVTVTRIRPISTA